MLSRTQIAFVVALVLLGAVLGSIPVSFWYQSRESRLRQEYLERYKVQDDAIGQERHRTKSLQAVIREAEKNNVELLETIAELKSRPETIRTIVQSVTKLEGVTEYVEVLPDSHIFRTGEGLAVASIEVEDKIRLETHSLEFKAIYVIADNFTSYRLSASSSLEPDKWFELSQDLQVTDIRERKHKILAPRVGIGVSLNIPSFEPGFGLYFSYLHPTPDIDILSIRAQVFNTPRLGVDAFSYRISKHIPFMEDLWIFGGASISLDKTWSADITIGTRL